MIINGNKQSYYDLLAFIDRIGPIEQVAKNPNIIRAIIAFDTDRHLLCALFDRINEAIEAGKILPEELTYFRSGMIMDDIINLKRTIREYSKKPDRELYPSEILDKINYVSLLKDPQTLSACYTHPYILDALCGELVPNIDRGELTW